MTIILDWHAFADMPAALLYEALQFRQAVFVVEQRSPYRDLDGLDKPARHLLLRAEGALAGYLRLIPPGPAAMLRIGRVALAPEWRRQGLGRRLMGEALRVAEAEYPLCTIAVGAQSYLVPFYESFGFAVVSAPYDDFGIPHTDMERRS